jgi:hypothetical protein
MHSKEKLPESCLSRPIDNQAQAQFILLRPYEVSVGLL